LPTLLDYQLVFAPELGINSADFVTEWNNTPNCRQQGEAKLDTSTQRPASMVEPTAMTTSAVLVSFAMGIGVHAVYDLVKPATLKVVQRTSTSKSTAHYSDVELQEIPQSDGDQILVVKIKENTTEVQQSESQKG